LSPANGSGGTKLKKQVSFNRVVRVRRFPSCDASIGRAGLMLRGALLAWDGPKLKKHVSLNRVVRVRRFPSWDASISRVGMTWPLARDGVGAVCSPRVMRA
ncbi:hypothetical protein CLOP_g25740, partial [Closterium sp. NIES-67]